MKIKKSKTKKITHIPLVMLFGIGIYFAIAHGLPAYEKKFGAQVGLLRNEEISPRDSVVIDFSQAVLWPEKNNKVIINPAIEADAVWSANGKQLVITPKEFWNPASSYVISYAGGRSVFLTKIAKVKLSFTTIKNPRVVAISPTNEQRDVVLDIENPIVVNFDKSTKDFFIKFTLEPGIEMAYENNLEKTQFKLIPKTPLVEGQKYKLEIAAKYSNDAMDSYKKIADSSFETAPKAPTVWEKDFTLRLAQAKQYTRPKITTGKYIDINISQQIMSIFENGLLINSFLVSSGKRGMDTPPGEYQIRNKATRVWSKTYGLFMPYWMAVAKDGKIGIHELPEWPSGYKEGANHLGVPVSHGCVRLGVGSAKTVFDWTEVGTPVVIY